MVNHQFWLMDPFPCRSGLDGKKPAGGPPWVAAAAVKQLKLQGAAETRDTRHILSRLAVEKGQQRWDAWRLVVNGRLIIVVNGSLLVLHGWLLLDYWLVIGSFVPSSRG